MKRLYNKAYPGRDQETRKEDLLQRFLDGLLDERTRFHIEFVKEPDSIDQAVFEVVNFTETRRRPREKDSGSRYRPTRAVRSYVTSDSEDEADMVQPQPDESDDSDTERIARLPSKGNRSRKITKPQDVPKNVSGTPRATETPHIERMVQLIEKLDQRLSDLENGRVKGHEKARNISVKSEKNTRSRTRQGQCFKCGEEGHWAKNCPQYQWVQVRKEGTGQPDQTQDEKPHHDSNTYGGASPSN